MTRATSMGLWASLGGMAIRWHFDRDKLTEREAQLVDALINVGLLAIAGTVAAGRLTRTREGTEKLLEPLRQQIAQALPDLGLRWEWVEPVEPPGESEGSG
jgi:hypothetical protein